MQTVIINAGIVALSFICMELMAMLTHRFVMHGFLWMLHKDHHRKTTSGFFERNDFFFLIFALPGIAGLFFGTRQDYSLWFWIGLGITLYGFAYFFVHDIFIHQRFRFLRSIDNKYFRAIRRAHKVHHKHLDREKGECFGMLWVPLKYFRNQKSNSLL